MIDFIDTINNLLTVEERLKVPHVKQSVCESCLECCSDKVPFKISEIKKHKKKHKKLFRKVEIVLVKKDSGYSEYNLRNKDNSGKCIFLKDSKCIIYEDRPTICRYFGSSPIAQCGYEGLDIYPVDKIVRYKLNYNAKISSIEYINLTHKRFEVSNE